MLLQNGQETEDPAEVTDGTLLVQTVQENFEGYTKKESYKPRRHTKRRQ
jgi:hypothetical protein